MYGVSKDILVEVDSSQKPFSKYTNSSKAYNFMDVDDSCMHVDDDTYIDGSYEVPQYHIVKFCMDI